MTLDWDMLCYNNRVNQANKCILISFTFEFQIYSYPLCLSV
jgi:hypothetical protein